MKAASLRRSIVAGVLLAALLPVHASPCVRPDAVTPDGGRYCGPLSEGMLHGEGVIEWSNGERYEGGFAHGKYSGSGRLRFASGDVYEGEFRDGLMQGRGRMTLVDGGIYTGEFQRDYFNGAGRFELPGDLVYEGAFENGRYHGRGRLSSPGSTYEGEFRQGEFWGEGKQEYADGRLYEGEFVRGRFHGKGRYVDANGDVYEGQFVDDVLTGTGRLSFKDGARYEGGFLKWRYQGAGIFTTAQGDIYEGEFANGELTRGRYVQKGGATYDGEFQRWRPHGRGVMQLANGDRYKGGFSYGVYDGEGTLTFARPRPDGETRQSGTWRYGMLEQPEERARLLANVESALYAQRRLLDRSFAALAPSDPRRINMYLLAVAGDGTQEVFRREVEFVRDQFARRFRTKGRTVVLVNSRSTVNTLPMATVTSVRAALKAIASRMDREKDVLFVYLTSHGSKEHELTLTLAGMNLQGLSAARLGELLKESGIRWKVVVVSACYGGGFADAILDEHTMVIAAARRDRQSFGCADENDFTYFGRAYFKEALPHSRSFQEAFGKAEALVGQWELEHAVVPAESPAPKASPEDQLSLPQMRSGKHVERHLKRFWSQFRR